jgi:hypothetical protein
MPDQSDLGRADRPDPELEALLAAEQREQATLNETLVVRKAERAVTDLRQADLFAEHEALYQHLTTGFDDSSFQVEVASARRSAIAEWPDGSGETGNVSAAVGPAG